MTKNVVFTLIAVALAVSLSSPLLAGGYIKASGNQGRAGIFVDGEYIGPVARFTVAERYAVDAGEHEITFKDPRYKDFTTKVTVEEGKTTTVKFKMEPRELAKPPYARLRFKGGVAESFISIASGDTSAVYLNGAFYGLYRRVQQSGRWHASPSGNVRGDG